MLRDFKKSPQSHGRSLGDYGLDIDPITNEKIDLAMPSEIEERMETINVAQSIQKLAVLDIQYSNNFEQQTFMNRVEAHTICTYICYLKFHKNSLFDNYELNQIILSNIRTTPSRICWKIKPLKQTIDLFVFTVKEGQERV